MLNKKDDVECQIRCDGKRVLLIVKNISDEAADFQVQVLSWKGVNLQPPVEGAYNLRWFDQLFDPISGISKLFYHSTGAVLLAVWGGIADPDGNEGRLQNIDFPSTQILRKAVVESNKDLEVNIEVCARRALAKPHNHTYILSISSGEGIFEDKGEKREEAPDCRTEKRQTFTKKNPFEGKRLKWWQKILDF